MTFMGDYIMFDRDKLVIFVMGFLFLSLISLSHELTVYNGLDSVGKYLLSHCRRGLLGSE